MTGVQTCALPISAGCILVGENRVRGTVSNSRYWEKRVTELLLEAQGNGDDIKITVR